MRILMSFVGKRDPWSPNDGTEGAIVTLARYARPDVVVMFPTARTLARDDKEETESHAEMVRELLGEEMGMPRDRFRIFPIALSDPRDREAILKFLRWTIPQVLRTIGDETPYELFVNLSSGTPQMHAAWLVAGGAGLLPKARLYEVSRPLKPGESGRPEERVREVSVGFLREDMLVQRFKEALGACLFAIAGDCMAQLATLTTDLRLSAISEILSLLMEAYVCLDVLEYKKALPQVTKAVRVISGKKDFALIEDLVLRQEKVLRELASQDKETVTGLVDIYHNSVRSYHRGAYADCLARLYRVYEGAVYLRLRNLGIEPVNLEKSQDKTGLVGDLLSRGITLLGLNTALKVLTAKDRAAESALLATVEIARLDGGYRRGTLASLLESLREVRNHSVVGHNMRSVSEDEAWQAVRLGEKVLECLCGKEALEAIRSYPFAKGSLELLGEVFSTR